MKMQLGSELFFPSEYIPVLRGRLANPRYKALWQSVLQIAEKVSGEKGLLVPGDTFTLWYYARNRLMDLSLSVLAKEDPAHITALNQILLDLAGRDIDFFQGPAYPNRPRTIILHGQEVLAGELETAQLAMGLAIAFDWGYAYLTEETKKAVRDALREKVLPLLHSSVVFQSEKWVMNHLCVLSTGLMLTAIVLGKEAYGAEIELAERGLNLWMEKIENDGSYGEFYHYWAYPTNCLFFGVYAAKTALGRELKNTHRIRKALYWAVYNQVGKHCIEGYPREVAVAVNHYDSPYLFQMEAPEALLFLKMFHDPLAKWYIDHFLMDNPPRPDCLHHVWHTANSILLALDEEEFEGRSPADLSMPLAAHFADTGYVYLRDSWDKCGEVGGDTVLTLQSGGGGRSCSHEHFDKNSFSLFAKGEYFLCDPGHSCYRGESHKSYDPYTASHNTVNIGGGNQSLAFWEKGMLHDEAKACTSYHNQAQIVGKNFNNHLTYIVSEARRCYSPYLKQFQRRIWFIRPGYFLLWDRVDAGEHRGEICNGLNVNNYDGKTDLIKAENQLFVRRPQADLQISYLFPRISTFRQEPGKLHMAYHILPDQQVEGAMGSATRITPMPMYPEERTDFLYLLCPREHGATPLQTKMHTLETDPVHVQWLTEFSFEVICDGETSRFTLENEDVMYDGPHGEHYVF